MFYKNIYKLFFKNLETSLNGTPKSAGTEIVHSTEQTETGSETVLITMVRSSDIVAESIWNWMNKSRPC